MSAAPAKSITQTVISELPDNQAASLKILLDRGIKVPPQPRIATLFKNSVGRGERDVRALARLLSDDPGIVGMLFAIPIAATGKGLFVYYYERQTRRSLASEDGALFRTKECAEDEDEPCDSPGPA